ncbi:metallophosphatase [Halothiobacillus diazotrophicus]|uniref:Metallophosphatase n=1 Tax=Halothiobacillus diazotrophicus TaxID=1860122 RepID=A0A191ZE38_9GAMM|nr:DNA repair exonuclease [Halothiobacillus diazotrophicus]ANJ66136.1 metallophosphatase [Halothiobacillus diazotrophicus]
MKILHTADWQIGRQYSGFDPDDAAPLAAERYLAVERIAALAQSRQVDAVLVAGDVFDSQTLRDISIRRLFNSLEGYAGPWVLLPGNHDAALVESIWTRAQRLAVVPSNVHLALQPEAMPFPDVGMVVLTAPLTQRHTFADLTAWFDNADTPTGLVRIGLAHGSVQGVMAADIDAPNPIAANRAETARLDYLALGDWHGLKQIDARTAYSGTPESDRFRNNDAGQVLEVEIDGPGALPRITPHRIGRYRWQALRVDLNVPSDLERLVASLTALNGDDVLDLRVSGRTDLSGQTRMQDLIAATAARVRGMRADFSDLHVQPTEADLADLQADGYLADVIAELQARQQRGPASPPGDAPAEIAREALTLLAGLLKDRQAPVGDEVRG